MVQCEMCGAETPSPRTVKVEGAELQVCDDCADFGTEVRQESSSSTSTKYSTSSSSGSGGTSGGGSSGGGGRRRRRGQEMIDDVEELAADYDARIRAGREEAGLSQEDLAGQLNEKASLIRKLEHGDMLPSDKVQRKLERALDISLSERAGDVDAEWEGGGAAEGMTLGDVVERKD